MILLLTLNYMVVCTFCFLCAGWMIVKVLREKAPLEDDDNSDGSGGIPSGFILPIFDPPGGCHLDTLLVDRMPIEEQRGTEVGSELTTTYVQNSARRHPLFYDPGHILSGWYSTHRLSLKV